MYSLAFALISVVLKEKNKRRSVLCAFAWLVRFLYKIFEYCEIKRIFKKLTTNLLKPKKSQSLCRSYIHDRQYRLCRVNILKLITLLWFARCRTSVCMAVRQRLPNNTPSSPSLLSPPIPSPPSPTPEATFNHAADKFINWDFMCNAMLLYFILYIFCRLFCSRIHTSERFSRTLHFK